jgi:hypothetical protein
VTCTRRYTFTFDRDDGHEHVHDKLVEACETYWWYDEPDVSGEQLTVSFLVTGRDQWWAHSRAMKLIIDATWALKPADIPVPVWDNLPPHMNRGSYRRG